MPGRVCPYCREPVKDEAVACPHCQRDIGPGHTLKTAGAALQSIGCGLTLLITVPVILLMLAASMCG
jgi:hypothetical protein